MPEKSPLESPFKNQTFREIFQSSVEGIIIVNEEGVIQLANPISEKIFGYEEGELVGAPIEILISMPIRSRHMDFRKSFNNNPSPRRMGAGRDLTGLRKNGTLLPIEISLSYMTVNGQFLVTAFIIDITERKKVEEKLKRSEEQLIQYAAELEKKVMARTEDLNGLVIKLERANNDLEKQIIERKKAEEDAKIALERERELNELKSKFVSVASHEFRTPLSTILSSTSLIDQYKERGDLDKINKHILRIKSSVNHLTSILNDFLSLGKLEEGKLETNPERINLEQFMAEVTEEVSGALKDHQQIKLTFEGTKKDLESDPRILRNILFNLISNASKYSKEGDELILRVVYNPKEVAISVKDKGIGIPKAEHKFLFDRFFRASNSSNTEGTGLGLHIVRRYVELLNGTITFVSEENEGSIFTINLPYIFL